MDEEGALEVHHPCDDIHRAVTINRPALEGIQRSWTCPMELMWSDKRASRVWTAGGYLRARRRCCGERSQPSLPIHSTDPLRDARASSMDLQCQERTSLPGLLIFLLSLLCLTPYRPQGTDALPGHLSCLDFWVCLHVPPRALLSVG